MSSNVLNKWDFLQSQSRSHKLRNVSSGPIWCTFISLQCCFYKMHTHQKKRTNDTRAINTQKHTLEECTSSLKHLVFNTDGWKQNKSNKTSEALECFSATPWPLERFRPCVILTAAHFQNIPKSLRKTKMKAKQIRASTRHCGVRHLSLWFGRWSWRCIVSSIFMCVCVCVIKSPVEDSHLLTVLIHKDLWLKNYCFKLYIKMFISKCIKIKTN